MSLAVETQSPSGWRERVKQMTAPELATPAILLAPSVLLLLIVIAYPMVQGLYFSFTNGSLMKGGDMVGLANYAKLLHTSEIVLQSEPKIALLLASKYRLSYCFYCSLYHPSIPFTLSISLKLQLANRLS
ncbi:MAG: hypothetical protein ACO1O4_07235 [Devosia sp.]